ncbi:C4-dicarboxylate transporter DctM subunit [Breoghania corrubedonensis]|uniref:TRAP transporter large permease protein n=1 Tax=Breoghania corrubedonensis TaxID=665038 RepID=A0A2T5V6S4_9HYPH|nr:TRAP transporter large permease [Breoghania corrubedonensis]PTW59426.1 C4-dicarboxylate transporter DctM subunit [Breoghania corrubedonensis]
MEAATLFVMVLTLLFLGVPISISLGLSSVLAIALFSNDSMSSVAQQLFTASQNYTLLAIPYFILASAFMSTGGVARRIIRFAIAAVGHVRGGLAIAAVFSCMLFAALSGSSPATVVAIGTIAIAGMREVGYTKDFAAGVIANAGTLGILIPPSIVMVVYAAATDVSVGRMFLAGVIPGIVAGLMLMVAIYINARIKKMPKQPFAGVHEVVAAGRDAGWGLFLIIIILGGIYGGVFTPTEAAAVAAVYSFIIAVFIYRDMGPLKDVPWVRDEDGPNARVGFSATIYALAVLFIWLILSFFFLQGLGLETRFWAGVVLALAVLAYYPVLRADRRTAGIGTAYLHSLAIWRRNLWQILCAFIPAFTNAETRKVMIDAARTTIMLMFIIVNALLFAHVLTSERIPQAITDWMVGAGFNWFTFLIAINLLLLLGGQFMEPSGLLLIVAPVVFPIAMKLGVDPVHLGIIMVVNMEIGMITPPIGLNLFVTSGITGMSLVQVVRASAPFVAILFLFLILVTYIEPLSTFLPYALMGPEIVMQR